MDRIKKEIASENKQTIEKENNSYFSAKFCRNLLNIWWGISLLWTAFHLDDQIKHSAGEVCEEWNKINSNKTNVRKPLKTKASKVSS